MREILFKARRVDNGAWIEGLLVKYPSAIQIGDCSPWYISVPPVDPDDNGGLYNVDPATVCQYTGLTDKYGKRIFEGDIIKLVTTDNEEITIICKFGNVRRQIFENEVEITGFYFTRSNDGKNTFPITHNYCGKHDTEIWEVIGNIHDKEG